MHLKDNAVIRPKQPGSWPQSPPKTALMVGSSPDLNQVVALAGMNRKQGRTLLNSRLFYDVEENRPFCIVGPFIGAPYAVILLETLIAWGVRKVIFFGWCGSLSAEVRTGDAFIPTSAFLSDGTSPHYTPGTGDLSYPSSELNAIILSEINASGIRCHQGPIWTTDAVFRETPELISRYTDKGALAVEMETAALFAAGCYRGIDISAVMAVSDELHTMTWKPGFSSTRFKTIRKSIAELMLCTAEKLQGEENGPEDRSGRCRAS